MQIAHDEANGSEMRRGAGDGELIEPVERVQSDKRPTLLLVGEGPAAEALADRAARAGLRCVGRVTPEAVAQRLALTVSLDVILLDLRGMDVAGRLNQATARALAGNLGVPKARLAVIVDLAGLDCALAMLDAPGVEFLCDPRESDIITLLVMASLRDGWEHAMPLHDAARDSDVARFERLSDEVRRLALTIERMAQGEGGAGLPGASGLVLDRYEAYRGEPRRTGEDAPLHSPVSRFPLREGGRAHGTDEQDQPDHAEIRQIIRARRMREQFLPAALFADPAWDMMLDLLAARLAGQYVSVSSLCIAASVPPTTALRWIRQLTDRGIFARLDDPVDRRRVFIKLTDEAAEAMLAWVQAVRRGGGLLAERR